jgi:uncharacterized membrane protein YqgA involved in biofilm formation
MRGLGVLVNTAAVICGGLIGLVLKRGLSRRFQDILTRACGIATIFIGAAGTLQGMLSVSADGSLTTHGTMLLIFSLVLGGLCGEALNLEQGLERLGDKLKRAIRSKNDSHFVEGFVNASLIICVGAMAIVGSIQDGLTGDHSMIFAKSVLDFVILIVLASSYGVGALFSAAALFVYQGSLTLLGMAAGAVISDTLIAELSYVGSSLIFCVGVNLCFGKKIKTGNYLPALLVPVFYEIIRSFL